MDILGALYFGPTSDLYKRLVVSEQKVDELETDVPASVDPSLFTVLARVKNPADAVYVRDQILATVAAARASLVPASALADAKSHERYAFGRTLDSTDRIAVVLGRYVSYKRSYGTVNNYYRTLDSLAPADVQATARKYFTDAGLIVTTLSKDQLPAGIDRAPALGTVAPATVFASATQVKASAAGQQPIAAPNPPGAAQPRVVLQISVLPQVDAKLLFAVGSAHDPVGKEGLAALTAAMIAARRIEGSDHR